MATEKTTTEKSAAISPAEAEPRGFGEHARGLAGEYAHEQGWGLNTDERTRQPEQQQNPDGGKDYEYGARDFGDEAVNTALDPEASGPMQNNRPARESKQD